MNRNRAIAERWHWYFISIQCNFYSIFFSYSLNRHANIKVFSLRVPTIVWVYQVWFLIILKFAQYTTHINLCGLLDFIRLCVRFMCGYKKNWTLLSFLFFFWYWMKKKKTRYHLSALSKTIITYFAFRCCSAFWSLLSREEFLFLFCFVVYAVRFYDYDLPECLSTDIQFMLLLFCLSYKIDNKSVK